MRTRVLLLPAFEPSVELLAAVLHGCPRKPGLDRSVFELQENAFPFVFDSGEPRYFTGQRGAADTYF